MSQGQGRRSAANRAQSARVARDSQQKGELPSMVDPWVANELPRPPDAPAVHTHPTVGFGNIPLVQMVEMIEWLTVHITSQEVIVTEIVNASPKLRKRIERKVEEMAKLRDVAEKLTEAQEDEPDATDETAGSDPPV